MAENNVETVGQRAEDKKQEKSQKTGQNVEKTQKYGKKALEFIEKHGSKAVSLPALGIVAIIVICVILIIGLIAFFVYMPGMYLENVKETARNIYYQFLDVFTGKAAEYAIKDEDILGLAERINAMGYDIQAFGFADVTEYTDNNVPSKINKENSDNTTYRRNKLS